MVTIDKGRTNKAVVMALNASRPRNDAIAIRQNKYLNSLVEQDGVVVQIDWA